MVMQRLWFCSYTSPSHLILLFYIDCANVFRKLRPYRCMSSLAITSPITIRFIFTDRITPIIPTLPPDTISVPYTSTFGPNVANCFRSHIRTFLSCPTRYLQERRYRDIVIIIRTLSIHKKKKVGLVLSLVRRHIIDRSRMTRIIDWWYVNQGITVFHFL